MNEITMQTLKHPIMARRHVRIMFVCTGNTCRSYMAENIFKANLQKAGVGSHFTMYSAGIHANVGELASRDALRALKMLGYTGWRHTAKQFDPEDAKRMTLIVCMTEQIKREVNMPNARTFAEIVGGEDIPDPYGKEFSAYISTARAIMAGFDEIIDYVVMPITAEIIEANKYKFLSALGPQGNTSAGSAVGAESPASDPTYKPRPAPPKKPIKRSPRKPSGRRKSDAPKDGNDAPNDAPQDENSEK